MLVASGSSALPRPCRVHAALPDFVPTGPTHMKRPAGTGFPAGHPADSTWESLSQLELDRIDPGNSAAQHDPGAAVYLAHPIAQSGGLAAVVNGIADRVGDSVKAFGQNFRQIQTGQVQNYLFLALVNALVLVIVYLALFQ